MVFSPPKWVPQLPFEPPSSITISDFVLNDEAYGRHSPTLSKAPFTCGITGKSYSVLEVRDRVEYLARALAEALNWDPNEASEWDKVIAVFSLNSIDYVPATWATQRLSGVSAPINAVYTQSELEHHLKNIKAKALFTCAKLLPVASAAASAAGIPQSRIFILAVGTDDLEGISAPSSYQTVDELISRGSSLKPLPALQWTEGQGKRQTAYLCTSSGTSGLPKSVMVSHRNVIANALQMTTAEAVYRTDEREVCLGLLPQSHSFCLMFICHTSFYRGDGVIIYPGFDFVRLLQGIEKFRMHRLYVVPTMVMAMLKAPGLMAKYDLSSITSLCVGAASLSIEQAEKINAIYPTWKILTGYGLTETSVVVCCVSVGDIWTGSCGSLLPGYQAKLIRPTDGSEVLGHNEPGELRLKSPTIFLGYLNDEASNKATFTADGWMKTGDLAVIRPSPNGHEHIFIVDRIKELIKVKGMQVAPAELETFLILHQSIQDVAVVPVPDDVAGELPKAYIVKSASALEKDDAELKLEIMSYAQSGLADYKQLRGGIEFLESLPKNAKGSVMRQSLKEQAKQTYYEMVQKKKDAVDAVQSKLASLQVNEVQVFEFEDE